MPADWESRYETGDTPWDKGAPHPALVDLLRESPVAGRVLVPGCGTGHDVRALAAAGAEVTGLDIAPRAVRAAQVFERVAGESYVVGDLFDLPEAMRGSFDCVWEHTCFCAIDPALRERYVEAVAGALKPGGNLLAVFYLDPGHASPDEGPPFAVSVAEVDRLFLGHFELVREWPPPATYPGREDRELMRSMRLR